MMRKYMIMTMVESNTMAITVATSKATGDITGKTTCGEMGDAWSLPVSTQQVLPKLLLRTDCQSSDDKVFQRQN